MLLQFYDDKHAAKQNNDKKRLTKHSFLEMIHTVVSYISLTIFHCTNMIISIPVLLINSMMV